MAGGTTRTTSSVSVTPPYAGTWTYALYAVYDEYASGSDERYSVVASLTVTSLTGAVAPTPTPSPTPTPTPTATVAPTAGVKLTWTPAPDRYDFRRYVCRRASGSTAPTSATGGTGVTITNETVRTTSYLTDNPGNGTWSYSLFVAYDETGSGSDERYSELGSITVTIVPTPTPSPSPTPSPTPTPTP